MKLVKLIVELLRFEWICFIWCHFINSLNKSIMLGSTRTKRPQVSKHSQCPQDICSLLETQTLKSTVIGTGQPTFTNGATDALQSWHYQWSTPASPNPALSPFPGGESYTPGLNMSVLFPIPTQSFFPKVPVQMQVIRHVHGSSFRQNDCWEPLKAGQLIVSHPCWVWVLSCQENSLDHSAVPSVSHA